MAPPTGWSPTPSARDHRSGSSPNLKRESPPLAEFSGGLLNPEWVEGLMGFPIGWTNPEGPSLRDEAWIA